MTETLTNNPEHSFDQPLLMDAVEHTVDPVIEDELSQVEAEGSEAESEGSEVVTLPTEENKIMVSGVRRVFRRFVQKKASSVASGGALTDGFLHNSRAAVDQEGRQESLEQNNFQATINSLLTDEALQARSAKLRQKLDTPIFNQIRNFYDFIKDNREELQGALKKDDKDAAHRLEAEYTARQDAELASLGTDDIREYDRAAYMLDQVEKYGNVRLGADESEAQALIGLLGEAGSGAGDDPGQEEAPFAHYKDNTTEQWKYVSDEDVRSYLSAKPFRDVSGHGISSKRITVEARKGAPLEVPTNLMMYAEGFTSWQGRGEGHEQTAKSEYGQETMSSLDVIRHYAGLSTEIPPVDEIRVYVQPDGKVFCDNNTGDSHRIAAAMLRGQQSIKADNITFISLNKNVLKSEDLRTKE